MKQIALYEAKTRLSQLLSEVEKGEQFLITRRGQAVARLSAASPKDAGRAATRTQRQQVTQIFDQLARLRAGTTLGEPLRHAIEAGRD